MDIAADFDAFNARLQAAALAATRHAVALPRDLAFHRSMDPALAADLDAFSARALALTNRLLALVAAADTSTASRKGKGKLESQDDVVDSFRALVVDPVDQLLEKTDMHLDEFLGRIKPPAISIAPAAPQKPVNVPHTRGSAPVVQHAVHLLKPQLLFRKKVDNADTPWYPTLPHKYNAQVPLGHIYRDADDGDGDETLASTHPYRYEIKHTPYPARMFQPATPVPPKSFADTPFAWVDTPAAFQTMLGALRQAPEIAVDLEHHDYRSYAGFVCLMQISTAAQDWIVDTLVLRDELTELNEVFTDPNIVKVFHGAESDIVWLQQDFNLYIVNLFDTFHASKILDFPRHGLANLLEMYCDFTTDKRYQLADWRVRPLPEEMLLYARSDTHYLLYIYAHLRNALLDRALSRAPTPSPLGMHATPPPEALVRQVLARSEETALRVYTREAYDAGGGGPGGWDALARKWNKGALLNSAGAGAGGEVYRRLHAWRDAVARADDESTRYVLSNRYLFQLAERPPADVAALLAAFAPVPPVVRKRAKELLDVIRAGVEAGAPGAAPAAALPEPVDADMRDEVVVAAVEKQDVPEASRLWSPATRAPLAAPSSSLFKPAPTSASTPAYAAPQSALFGGRAASSTTADTSTAHFADLVARIHRALVVLPSPPLTLLDARPSATDAPSGTDVTDPATTGMQVEIPYVPAAQRQPPPPAPVDDALVVVGRAKARKRKRGEGGEGAAGALGRRRGRGRDADESSAAGGASRDEGEGEGAGAGAGKSEADAPFDFGAVPNILDDNPAAEPAARRRAKKQKGKGAVFGYGDFPAPPQAHSELRSGNVSHTFK